MKNKVRIGIIVLVLLLAIGFASVTTNLIINGTSRVASSDISGLVYFSYANTDPDPGASATRANNNTVINFTSKKLTDVGDTATLDYTVYNDSSQYDANVVMSIQMPTNQPGVTWSDYVDITYTGFQPAEQGNDHHVVVDGKGRQNGKIEITLKKLSTEDITIEFIITLDVTAVERTSEATTAAPAPSCNDSNDGVMAFFDPVSDAQTCSKDNWLDGQGNMKASQVTAVKNGSSTCYAWRVLRNCNGEYTLQLDHQIATSEYITQADYNAAATAGAKTNHWIGNNIGSNDLGPITAFKTLESATSTWVRVSPLTYSYSNVIDIATGNRNVGNEVEQNYGVLNCNAGKCTVSNNPTYQFTNNLRARLITYEDVRSIKGASNPTVISANRNNSTLVISNTWNDEGSHYTADAASGNTLWWLFENTLTGEMSPGIPYDNDGIYGNNVGATLDAYAGWYGEAHTIYWTMSPGIKTPGIVGDNQVGLNSYALLITAVNFDANYPDKESTDDEYNAGTMLFVPQDVEAGIRPVITVPAAQVRLANEN